MIQTLAMPPKDKPPSIERQHTDESLRVEREITDQVLADERHAVDELADAVITRARRRADAVLASAREKTYRGAETQTRRLRTMQGIESDWAIADRLLRDERAAADELLRCERTQHVAKISVERDGTDKDLLDERVRSDRQVAIRDDFLGIVSHDLGNMLNSIRVFAGLIEESVLLENHAEQVTNYAGRIQSSSVRMSRLIGDLVDVASIEAGALEVTCELAFAADVVAEAIETFGAQAVASDVSLESNVVPSSNTPFDPARILQVLINLLSNAIKFTQPGGKVTVHSERTETGLLFSVADTGVGIPSDKLESVFERFLQLERRDRRGIGLGLYISKCIVQGHGGRIWAESEVGRGSTFSFTLPLSPTSSSVLQS